MSARMTRKESIGCAIIIVYVGLAIGAGAMWGWLGVAGVVVAFGLHIAAEELFG